MKRNKGKFARETPKGGRIVDDPNRLKLCRKCGETKPVSEFWKNGQGYPSSDCRDCHRAIVRDYHRRKRQDSTFRKAEAERARADYRRNPEKKRAMTKERYWRDAEAARAQRREQRRASGSERARYWRLRPLDSGRAVRICNCHGKVCRLWLVDDTIRCAVTARALSRFRVSAA